MAASPQTFSCLAAPQSTGRSRRRPAPATKQFGSSSTYSCSGRFSASCGRQVGCLFGRARQRCCRKSFSWPFCPSAATNWTSGSSILAALSRTSTQWTRPVGRRRPAHCLLRSASPSQRPPRKSCSDCFEARHERSPSLPALPCSFDCLSDLGFPMASFDLGYYSKACVIILLYYQFYHLQNQS